MATPLRKTRPSHRRDVGRWVPGLALLLSMAAGLPSSAGAAETVPTPTPSEKPQATATQATAPGTAAPSTGTPSPHGEEADIEKIKEKYWARGNEAEMGVVQNRLYPKVHRVEVSLTGGALSGDPFLSTYTLGLTAGYHFSEFFALHLVGWKAIVSPSAALKTLQQQLNTTANTNEPRFYFGPEARASVLYGKLSLLGAAILYFDAYFSLGGGIVSTESGSSGAVTAGVGQQIHVSRTVSLDLAYKFLWYHETVLGKLPSNFGQPVSKRGNLSSELSLGISIFFDTAGAEGVKK